MTLGGISQTPSYLEGKGKEAVQAMLLVTVVILMVTLMVMMMVIIVTPTVQAVFKKQIDVFVEEGLDFVLCEVSSDQCRHPILNLKIMYNHKIKVKIEHFSFLKLYHTCMSMFYHFQYFEHIEETEWAIEECLRSELPVILIKISLMVLAVDHNHAGQ